MARRRVRPGVVRHRGSQPGTEGQALNTAKGIEEQRRTSEAKWAISEHDHARRGRNRGEEGKKSRRGGRGCRPFVTGREAEAQALRSQAGRAAHGTRQDAVLDPGGGEETRGALRGP